MADTQTMGLLARCTPETLVRSSYYSDTYRLKLKNRKTGITADSDVTVIRIPFEIEKERELMRRFELTDEDLPEFYDRFAEAVERHYKISSELSDYEPNSSDNNSAALADNIHRMSISYRRVDKEKIDGAEYTIAVSEPLTPLSETDWLRDDQISLSRLAGLVQRLAQCARYFSQAGYSLGQTDLDNVFVVRDETGKDWVKFGFLGYSAHAGEKITYAADAAVFTPEPVLTGEIAQNLATDIYSISKMAWSVLEGNHYTDAPQQLDTIPQMGTDQFIMVLRTGLTGFDTAKFKTMIGDKLRAIANQYEAGEAENNTITMRPPRYLDRPLPVSVRLTAKLEAEKAAAEAARLEEEERIRAEQEAKAAKKKAKKAARARVAANTTIVIIILLLIAAVAFLAMKILPSFNEAEETPEAEPVQSEDMDAEPEPEESEEEEPVEEAEVEVIPSATSEEMNLYVFDDSILNLDGTVNPNYKMDDDGNIVTVLDAKKVIMAANTSEYVFIDRISIYYYSSDAFHFTALTPAPEKMVYRLAEGEESTEELEEQYTVWETDRDGYLAVILKVEPENATNKQVIIDITGTDAICITSAMPLEESETVADDYMKLLETTLEESFKAEENKDPDTAVMDSKYYVDGLQRVRVTLGDESLCGFTLTGYDVEAGQYPISITAASGDAKWTKSIQVTELGVAAEDDPEPVVVTRTGTTAVTQPVETQSTDTTETPASGETTQETQTGTGTSDSSTTGTESSETEEPYTPPDPDFTFVINGATLQVGGKARMRTNHSAEFWSSNTAVAYPGTSGYVIAVGEGTCTIYAKCMDTCGHEDQVMSITVTVVAAENAG